MRVMAPRAGATCALTTDARPVCWCNQMKRRQEKKRVLEGAKVARTLQPHVIQLLQLFV